MVRRHHLGDYCCVEYIDASTKQWVASPHLDGEVYMWDETDLNTLAIAMYGAIYRHINGELVLVVNGDVVSVVSKAHAKALHKILMESRT